MGLIPEGSAKYNDLVDLVTQSATKTIRTELPDGSFESEEIVDDEIMWWKTHSIDSNQFSRLSFELKEWERMAKMAKRYMTAGRARDLAEEILGMSESYRRSIDSKSSEAMRDSHNSKRTLLDTVGRNVSERVFTTKGDDIKTGFFQSLIGRKKKEAYEEPE